MTSETFPERDRARMAAERKALQDLSDSSREFVAAHKELEDFVNNLSREELSKRVPFKGKAEKKPAPAVVPARPSEAVGLRLVPKARTTTILMR